MAQVPGGAAAQNRFITQKTAYIPKFIDNARSTEKGTVDKEKKSEEKPAEEPAPVPYTQLNANKRTYVFLKEARRCDGGLARFQKGEDSTDKRWNFNFDQWHWEFDGEKLGFQRK
mmetsp:Transcript_27374/g.59824  ORF Transcript_27374/g.59824 Transcript_27374/m.59824 type:complete len:115 (+) Transcript_27374:558-902(+)